MRSVDKFPDMKLHYPRKTTTVPMRRMKERAVMTRSYRHLTFEERCQVKILKKSGLSKGSIAQHSTLISVRTTPSLR